MGIQAFAGNVMPKNLVSTVVKLLVACLVVGFVLSYLDLSPEDALKSLGIAAVDVFELGASVFEWGLSYILIGAVIVVPVWLIAMAWKIVRNK